MALNSVVPLVEYSFCFFLASRQHTDLLTQHEDGWIYGVFCSESKDKDSNDLSAAVAQAGIVRTKDLKTWERLPNLKSNGSPL